MDPRRCVGYVLRHTAVDTSGSILGVDEVEVRHGSTLFDLGMSREIHKGAIGGNTNRLVLGPIPVLTERLCTGAAIKVAARSSDKKDVFV